MKVRTDLIKIPEFLHSFSYMRHLVDINKENRYKNLKEIFDTLESLLNFVRNILQDAVLKNQAIESLFKFEPIKEFELLENQIMPKVDGKIDDHDNIEDEKIKILITKREAEIKDLKLSLEIKRKMTKDLQEKVNKITEKNHLAAKNLMLNRQKQNY